MSKPEGRPVRPRKAVVMLSSIAGLLSWMLLLGGVSPVVSVERDTSWLLSAPSRASLSAAGELELLWTHAPIGLFGTESALVSSASECETPAEDGDVRVNDPCQDLAPNCNTQNEVTIARSGLFVVAGWNDFGQLCEQRAQRTRISVSGYGYSVDGGATWTDGGTIQPQGAWATWNFFGDPVLAAGPEGSFYYASLATDASGRSIIAVERSADAGRSWLPPVDASPGRDEAAFQDKPWIVVDTTGSDDPEASDYNRHKGNIYVAWTEKSPEGERILVSRSVDRGGSFSAPRAIVPNSIAPIGTQVAIGPHGEVYVTLLKVQQDVFFTRSLDGGDSFETPRRIAEWDTRIGDPGDCAWAWPFDWLRQDKPENSRPTVPRRVLQGPIRVESWPTLAVDTTSSPYRGRIYLGIAVRPADSLDAADVYLLSSDDRGDTWAGGEYVGEQYEPSHRVNDDTGTTDQFHPQVAVGADGFVALSWYDRRLSDDPLRENWEIDVFGAISSDGGATFGPNFRISDESFPPPQTNVNTNGAAGCYMGEYNGMTAGPKPGEFLVAWGDNRDGPEAHRDPNVYVDRIGVPIETGTGSPGSWSVARRQPGWPCSLGRAAPAGPWRSPGTAGC